MIIDATNQITGRIASFAAKRAILGENIEIVNCENAVITGDKNWLIADWRKTMERGHPLKGPFTCKRPDRFVRRIIRGMLPYKQDKGKKAFKRIQCHMGVPEQFKGKSFEKVPGADVSKVPNLKYLSVKEICRSIGANI